ncbi:hypothetical protein Micau_0390 [Micromonospora aurantiaca ATCC 27029]|nr:hypothetical protein Micau_0390 [Micromonospora aurantiaca ATCC 27029]
MVTHPAPAAVRYVNGPHGPMEDDGPTDAASVMASSAHRAVLTRVAADLLPACSRPGSVVSRGQASRR